MDVEMHSPSSIVDGGRDGTLTAPPTPTKQRQGRNYRKAATAVSPPNVVTRSRSNTAAGTISSQTLLSHVFPPTPVKTPRRRQVTASTSRFNKLAGLSDNVSKPSRLLFPTHDKKRSGDFDIFTDGCNKEPIEDKSLDNPFLLGRKRKRKPGDPVKKAIAANMVPDPDQMVFVFRGKRVHRRIDTGKNGLGLQPKLLFPPTASNEDDDEWEDEEDDEDGEMAIHKG